MGTGHPTAQATFDQASRLTARGRLLEARRLCFEGLGLEPGHEGCALLLFNIASRLGDVDEAMGAAAAVADRFVDDPEVCSALANAANTGWSLDADAVFRLHARYGRALEKRRGQRKIPISDPGTDRSLQVGIVTYDYKLRSSVSFFLAPILRRIRTGFEVTAYHVGPEGDAGTARFRAMVDQFRHIPGATHDQLADQIRADRVDVAMELIGHTGVRRLPAFVPRCAPVQVSYLGYSNTSGLATMDWRIVDGVTDPPGSEGLNTERLWRLGPCFVCFEPDAETPPVASAPSAYKDRVTFGAFSALNKLTSGTLRRWARVLDAVPGSRLLLKNRAGPEELSLLRERMNAARIDPRRVEFRGMARGYPEHLDAYADVDIALDTWPYNGTTTVCESLLMGVPIVGLAPDAAHDRHAARVTMSLLSAAGFGEWVARDEDEWVQMNAALAGDPAGLDRTRRTMRDRLLSSALCDGERFAAGFWDAVRGMWRERVHCES